MKTYKQTIEKPRLIIETDSYPFNPRDSDNIGHFITYDTRYLSPDEDKFLEDIILQAGNIANSLEEHIANIKDMLKDWNETFLYIYPITKHEHGKITYSLGSKFGFDYSNNGFYIVTQQCLDNIGVEKSDEKEIIEVIKDEIKQYNMFMNNEYLKYTLYDENGEFEIEEGSYESLEDIKAVLGPEWKNEDMNNYFK